MRTAGGLLAFCPLSFGLLALGLPTPALAQFVVQGLDGPVRPAEVDAFKLHMKARLAEQTANGPFNVLVGNRNNNYVYGQSGGALESLVTMYEVTRDREVMDQMIWFADQMLLHRNDRFQTRTIFTGKQEPCWPNKLAGAVDERYCGTEQGDVLGHITAVARLIARNRTLWNERTPVEDRLKLGATYLERARGYIRECRQTIDGFITPWFVHPTSRRLVFPDTDSYGALGERYARARGKTVPWNQNTMLVGGYLNIADALDALGEDRATVAAYDAISKAFVDAFFANVAKAEAGGQPVYRWSYASDDMGPDFRYPEDIGHGGYDFWGIYKAFVRGKLGLKPDQMVAFANTVRYVIMRPNGSFSEKVNGTGGDRPSLGSTWLYVIFFRPDLYRTIAGSLLPAAAGDPDTAARVLWAKHMNASGWMMDPPPPPPGPDQSDGGTQPVADAAGADRVDGLASDGAPDAASPSSTGGTGAVSGTGGQAATGGTGAAGQTASGGSGAGGNGGSSSDARGAGAPGSAGSGNSQPRGRGASGCQLAPGLATQGVTLPLLLLSLLAAGRLGRRRR